jgi:uncharacterized GH25 family protein
MKKLLLSVTSILLFSATSFSQWIVQKVDNGFDTPYKIAFTHDDQSAYLKLENYKGIAFYISGVYVCEESVSVDVSFTVNGDYKKYSAVASVSDNRKTVFISNDITANPELLEDFKNASSVKIRINDTVCDTEIYEFKMNGSTAAFYAVSNP